MLAASALIGACFGLWLKVGAAPGADTVVFSWDVGEGQKITDSIAHLIPSGVGFDFLTGNVVGIFVFAVFIGIAARRMSGKYMDTVKPFLDFTDAAFSVITSVCKAVIAYKPMGSGCGHGAFTAAYGPAFLLMLVKMLLVLCAASLAMLAVQMILCAVSGVSPAAFFRAGKAAMKKALVTRSGSACLPDAQEALAAGLGLKKEITDEVSAYAIASGMQGCGAHVPGYGRGVCRRLKRSDHDTGAGVRPGGGYRAGLLWNYRSSGNGHHGGIRSCDGKWNHRRGERPGTDDRCRSHRRCAKDTDQCNWLYDKCDYRRKKGERVKTVIIGGVAAGMSAASKLKRLLGDAVEIVVYEKGGEVSFGACGIPFYISDHIKQGKELIARTAEEFAKSGIPVKNLP